MGKLNYLLICVVLRLSYILQAERTYNETIQILLNASSQAEPNLLDAHTTQAEQYKFCGVDKICVPRYQCFNGTINDWGKDVISPRTGELKIAECGFLEECCDISNKVSFPTVAPSPSQFNSCGFRGFRILKDNNNDASFGEFPWMVAILQIYRENKLYECGGALIGPTVVLTAAHCVYNHLASELITRAGEWNSQETDEALPHQDRRVREIIVHEQFNKVSLYNNVALLIVESPFEWQEHVRPICLPPPGSKFDIFNCFATGWGKDKLNGAYHTVLKRVELQILPTNNCVSILRSTRLGKDFELHDSLVCASVKKDREMCNGDGGSPLVCPLVGQENRYYQVGIVAWGIGCGEQNIPGVYANVPHLRAWIEVKFASRGIDTKYFTP